MIKIQRPDQIERWARGISDALLFFVILALLFGMAISSGPAQK